jgi:hypothetical protein
MRSPEMSEFCKERPTIKMWSLNGFGHSLCAFLTRRTLEGSRLSDIDDDIRQISACCGSDPIEIMNLKCVQPPFDLNGP